MAEIQLVIENIDDVIEQLYRRFGVRRMIRALLRAIARQQRYNNAVSNMSDRMRRDVGLPVRESHFQAHPIDLILPRL